MKKVLLIALLGVLAAAPARAEEMTFDVEGLFTGEGFLENGTFQGTLSYSSDAPDQNPGIDSIGLFELSAFEINILDQQANQIDTITEENSEGSIFLREQSVTDGVNMYQLFTTPDTEADADAFLKHGSLNAMFEFPVGDDVNNAPPSAPGQFMEGKFSSFAAAGSFDGITDPQEIASAVIEESDSLVETNEPQVLAGLLLFLGGVTASRFVKSRLGK